MDDQADKTEMSHFTVKAIVGKYEVNIFVNIRQGFAEKEIHIELNKYFVALILQLLRLALELIIVEDDNAKTTGMTSPDLSLNRTE